MIGVLKAMINVIFEIFAMLTFPIAMPTFVFLHIVAIPAFVICLFLYIALKTMDKMGKRDFSRAIHRTKCILLASAVIDFIGMLFIVGMTIIYELSSKKGSYLNEDLLPILILPALIGLILFIIVNIGAKIGCSWITQSRRKILNVISLIPIAVFLMFYDFFLMDTVRQF